MRHYRLQIVGSRFSAPSPGWADPPHPAFSHPLLAGAREKNKVSIFPSPQRGEGPGVRQPSRASRCHLFLFLLLPAVLLSSCNKKRDSGADPSVTTLGSTEVTAQLLAIPGEFPPNDLYNYAYVLKYRVLTVHRGQLRPGAEILVAHYNPLKPRSSAQDELSGKLGGNLDRFRSQDVHRMALEEPLDQHWMGGVIDKYFDQKGVRYWAVWTNLAKP
jgi:hypothetical protein